MAKKHDLSEKKVFRLSRAVAGVTQNWCHAYSLPHKRKRAEILAFGLIWANLMHFILRILKFRFLRVATKERFFEVLLLRPQGPVFVAWKWFDRVKKVSFSK
jgi:hypothetical protein